MGFDSLQSFKDFLEPCVGRFVSMIKLIRPFWIRVRAVYREPDDGCQQGKPWKESGIPASDSDCILGLTCRTSSCLICTVHTSAVLAFQ